ncbi:hypothetical protein X777_13279 [Ooceraea biroi]|uniref:Uncharacterized protein n=1 Tax=Ooceraea biroi TaxID=2015173 RepID=A0A026WWU9_OOCBI|nr:hypothetical protein X777_13279 [Ooceraea biroi]
MHLARRRIRKAEINAQFSGTGEGRRAAVSRLDGAVVAAATTDFGLVQSRCDRRVARSCREPVRSLGETHTRRHVHLLCSFCRCRLSRGRILPPVPVTIGERTRRRLD